MRIMEVAVTLVLVTVVLLPVSAAFPIKPEVRPDEVTAAPIPSQLGAFEDIYYVSFFYWPIVFQAKI
jgi:hypothetical protein